jgi:hypothetical protein
VDAPPVVVVVLAETPAQLGLLVEDEKRGEHEPGPGGPEVEDLAA